jgi:hypothetical protein
MADIIVQQFEIQSDAKGAARAAAYIAAQLLSGAATKVLAIETYSRESGSEFMVVVMATTMNKYVGAAIGGDQQVVAVTAEIESGGVINFAKALNAAVSNFAAGSPPFPLTNFISLNIARRNSGSAYATAILAS